MMMDIAIIAAALVALAMFALWVWPGFDAFLDLYDRWPRNK